MRSLLSFLLVTTALPALADTIPATSRITAVTVYPEGAKLTREVTFTVPAAGSHELLVTDLPSVDDLIVAQIAGGEGLQVGAYNIRTDRLPPREDPLTPEQEAAKAKVEELEASEQAALLALDAVQAKIDAAEAQVRFLSSFSGGLPDGATPDTIKAMAAMIGTETLAARETALEARAEYWPVQKALIETQEALTKARDAYAALPSADMDYAALSVAVEAAGAGEQTVTITQYVGGAYWQPTYELNLTREGDDAISLKRAVLVTQYTGEDWSDVALTLSSSAPSLEASPSSLWPELRSIEPEMTGDDLARMEAVASPAMIEEEVEIVAEKSGAIIAGAAIEGDTVVYNYPNPVTVATGVEDLRLSLDDISLAAVVKAVAVPRHDATAYFVASFVNPSDEPLLPGYAVLYREGVLVGSTNLGMIAPGVEAEVGFGAIETLRIKREMPLREGGETGVFTTGNELAESVIITVENTGDETWPVRLLDQVPYSEQSDLEIEYSASPEPTETDVDGQRGILAWDFDLAAGGKETLTLEHRLSWPEGMVLR
ncbi:MAG: DUF4139 domain-containing protein [Tabrizicola sp.]|nr:DUF4139 domain-containing protein [Tabrizicola sp.]